MVPRNSRQGAAVMTADRDMRKPGQALWPQRLSVATPAFVLFAAGGAC